MLTFPRCRGRYEAIRSNCSFVISIFLLYHILFPNSIVLTGSRKKADPTFADGYDVGYEDFKIGVLIKELRLKEGMTQEELAKRLHTKKSVISRMENHSEDIRLSTLERVAEVFGKRIQIAIEE